MLEAHLRRKYVAGLALLITMVTILVGMRIVTEIELRRIQSRYPPIGQFVSVDGLRLHYRREGGGRPVVMLHGRDGALQEFTFSIFGQVAENYVAIVFDRPGYGYSDWPQDEPLSLQIQARLIHRALHELKIEEPLLVGHSYGGALILQYLLDYPDEATGAVLLGPVAYMPEPPDGSLFTFPNIPVIGPLLAHTVLLPIGQRVADGIYQRAFWPDPAPGDYVDTMKALYLRPANFTATAGELAVMQESVQAISPQYDEIQVPVAVIAGTFDQMVDVDEHVQSLAGSLPNGWLISVEGAGHKVHHTHPEIVMDAIDQIMRASEQ